MSHRLSALAYETHLDPDDAPACRAVLVDGMVSVRCDASASACATCHGDSHICSHGPYCVCSTPVLASSCHVRTEETLRLERNVSE